MTPRLLCPTSRIVCRDEGEDVATCEIDGEIRDLWRKRLRVGSLTVGASSVPDRDDTYESVLYPIRDQATIYQLRNNGSAVAIAPVRLRLVLRLRVLALSPMNALVAASVGAARSKTQFPRSLDSTTLIFAPWFPVIQGVYSVIAAR